MIVVDSVDQAHRIAGSAEAYAARQARRIEATKTELEFLRGLDAFDRLSDKAVLFAKRTLREAFVAELIDKKELASLTDRLDEVRHRRGGSTGGYWSEEWAA